MIYGTCYFVSEAAARRYYSQQEPGDGGPKAMAAYVKGKIRAGEICIGLPPTKPGELLVVIDGAARWAIATAD